MSFFVRPDLSLPRQWPLPRRMLSDSTSRQVKKRRLNPYVPENIQRVHAKLKIDILFTFIELVLVRVHVTTLFLHSCVDDRSTKHLLAMLPSDSVDLFYPLSHHRTHVFSDRSQTPTAPVPRTTATLWTAASPPGPRSATALPRAAGRERRPTRGPAVTHRPLPAGSIARWVHIFRRWAGKCVGSSFRDRLNGHEVVRRKRYYAIMKMQLI